MRRIQWVAEKMAAQLLQVAQPEAQIEHLCFDSRRVEQAATTLFFALAGERRDGHAYIGEMYQKGVRNFVVRQVEDVSPYPEANFLVVENTLAALQKLAAAHRQQFNIPVIGITGSNGKTIVKDWLTQLLRPDFNVVSSPKSYNSQIGVPISVWAMNERHQMAIFEAGISQMHEMAHLEAIIQPTFGIFTNIGAAHREGFASQQLKIEEKLQLFRHCRCLVFCADHTQIAAAVERQLPHIETFTWSRGGAPANLQVIDIHILSNNTARIYFIYENHQHHLSIPFSDAASIENACHCLAICLLLKMSIAKICRRFRHLEPVAMRLELKSAIHRCVLVDDAYSLDLSSLSNALHFVRTRAGSRLITVLLSDFVQSGLSDETLYEKVSQILTDNGVNRVLGIGKSVPLLRQFLPQHIDCQFFNDTDAFLEQMHRLSFCDEIILLKGARKFAFERIAKRLEEKVHKTVLEINLSALLHNLKVFSRHLHPEVKILAMVKANGYGCGAVELVRCLAQYRVDYLGVAYPDEGVELRQAGVRTPILVLNSEPASMDILLRHQLEPAIFSSKTANAWTHYLKKNKKLGIHLKFDTGMHRLGFEADDLPELIEVLKRHPHLEVKSIMSHLAASDSPQHDTFTHEQARRFVEMCAYIEQQLGYKPLRHLVSTSGIMRFPEYHFDMVRLGIGLFGISIRGLSEPLRVVNTLKTTISQIKQLPPGETVGYGRHGKIHQPARIATIGIGYSDGLMRLAGNGNLSVSIHGKPAPTVGNVCMDMTMIDVTHIPEAKEGDEVIVFGENPKVEEQAHALQTIPYELFTNISERVKRVYYQE